MVTTVTVLDSTGTTRTVNTLPALAQAASAASLPVVVASDQSSLPVTVDNVNANGSTTDADSTPVAWSTEGKAQLGSLTETAPASDTASSGLNGRLQRIAQRLTSLIALIPASLGAKAASASLSVTQAGLEYETVAASQTAQVLGATGATGDYLSHVVIQPATTAAGTVTILDNATVIFTFTTGTLADLRPITVPFGLFSVSGAWKVTTGASVAVIGVGDFT